MTARPETPIAVEDLSIGYGRDAPLLEGLSMLLRSGTLCALVGPNGSGKSTLIRTLAGLHRPRHGRVTVGGHDLYGPRRLLPADRARRVAVHVPTRTGAGYLRVSECVALGAYPHTVRATPAELGAIMDRFGIAPIADRQLATLSDGERQRTLLARAFLQARDVLLLDEPAAHLDPPAQTTLFIHIRGLLAAGRLGAAVVAVHELHLALQFADLFVVLGRDQRAEIVAVGDGTVERLRRTLEAAFGAEDHVTFDITRGWFVPSESC